MQGPAYWIGFNVFVVAMLALDLFVLHRKAHAVRIREALAWSLFWIFLALAFCGWIYLKGNHKGALEFLAAYLVEKSLSVDNLFVFLVIFTYFAVPPAYQHRILFWGILGAIIMRAILIFAGIELIQRFHWTMYLLAALLILLGVKMLFQGDEPPHPERNPVIRLVRKFLPTTTEMDGSSLWIRRDGRWLATPLFVVLIVIEVSDLMFAVDSIPAVLAISPDPFIVYTSNIFAILGLRALYFLLARVMDKFHYLHVALAAVLIFVGLKMGAKAYRETWEVPIGLSLGIIAGLLGLGVAASLAFPQHAGARQEAPHGMGFDSEQVAPPASVSGAAPAGAADSAPAPPIDSASPGPDPPPAAAPGA